MTHCRLQRRHASGADRSSAGAIPLPTSPRSAQDLPYYQAGQIRAREDQRAHRHVPPPSQRFPDFTEQGQDRWRDECTDVATGQDAETILDPAERRDATGSSPCRNSAKRHYRRNSGARRRGIGANFVRAKSRLETPLSQEARLKRSTEIRAAVTRLERNRWGLTCLHVRPHSIVCGLCRG